MERNHLFRPKSTDNECEDMLCSVNAIYTMNARSTPTIRLALSLLFHQQMTKVDTQKMLSCKARDMKVWNVVS